MTVEVASDSRKWQTPAPGWADIGRFFVAYFIVRSVLSLCFGLAVVAVASGGIASDPNFLLPFYAARHQLFSEIVGLAVGLFIVARFNQGGLPMLGIVGTRPIWFTAGFALWGVLLAILVWGFPWFANLPPSNGFIVGLQQLLSAEVSLIERKINVSPNHIIAATLNVTIAVLTTIVASGLLFRTLQTVFSLHWAAIGATLTYGIGVTVFLIGTDGALPAVLIASLGTLLNCYLVASSRSVLPAACGAAMFAGVATIYAAV